MPIYQTVRTYESGFYNSVNDDRKYNAEDISDAYFGLLTNGVKPNDDGTISTDLNVLFVTGMQIRVAAGKGLFGYKRFRNKSNYNITLDNAGVTNRYDCIIIRADNTDAYRDTYIYVKSLDHVPTISDLTRSENVQEYLLAYVLVPAQAIAISQSRITDTRGNATLCGFVQGCFNQVDGTAITAQWNAAFNDWFDDVKDNFLATATLIRAYSNNYITRTANESIINIGIPQYNRNLDTLLVYVNGSLLPSGRFTINSNTQITLSLALPVIGTQVTFEVWKSIDGSQAQSVVAEVGELQSKMNAVEQTLEHHYYCNGTTDNNNISNIISTYQNASTELGSMRLIIHGVFGAVTPRSGTGTSADPYVWIRASQGSNSNRRVIIDCSDCSEIRISCPNSTHNVILFGKDVNIVGASIIAAGGTTINMFSPIEDNISYAENCRFTVVSVGQCMIAKSGTFINCKANLTSMVDNAYCFYLGTRGLLTVQGGEYYAYATTGKVGAVILIPPTATTGTAIANNISCPTVAETGYNQSYAIADTTDLGLNRFTDTITTLNIMAGSSIVRNTIALSKPNFR